METVAGGSSEILTGDDVSASNELPLSVNIVVFNDDLLVEILLTLPILSFKSVSKRWLSLITSPTFILHRRLIPNIDPTSGLFIRDPFETDRYDFVPLDGRIPAGTSRHKNIIKLACSNVFVKQSCNGLRLCYTNIPDKYYVYNPSINLFKMLPQRPHNMKSSNISCGMKMAFNPFKSPYYKVMYATGINDDDVVSSIQIQTYSSETHDWSSTVYSSRFTTHCFSGFEHGIYWNDAIHWLTIFPVKAMHYKLDTVNEVPALTNMQLPLLLNGNVARDRKLFESRGCLLLLSMDNTDSHRLNIYEMSNGCSEWSFKYFVNLNDIGGFTKHWRICSRFWCIVLGEQKEDCFMVIRLNEKVIQYNIVLKTWRDLFETKLFSPSSFLFTASFASV